MAVLVKYEARKLRIILSQIIIFKLHTSRLLLVQLNIFRVLQFLYSKENRTL